MEVSSKMMYYYQRVNMSTVCGGATNVKEVANGCSSYLIICDDFTLRLLRPATGRAHAIPDFRTHTAGRSNGNLRSILLPWPGRNRNPDVRPQGHCGSAAGAARGPEGA